MSGPEDRITLGDDAEGPDLGPDERDLDLMDGSWEERYYRGHLQQRDWHSITIALSLLVLLALAVPAIVVFTR